MAAPGATLTRYPKSAPVVTKFVVPGQPPQYSNSPGSYGPSPSAESYQQQHPDSAPTGQHYAPPGQVSYPPQQYGASTQSYSYTQPPPYNTPPANPGYQAPHYNQYPPTNGPQQHNGPGYHLQQYGPPATAPYQSPANQYPPRRAATVTAPAAMGTLPAATVILCLSS